VHIQDVYAALRLPRDEDPVTVRVALDHYLDALDGRLRAGDVSALRLCFAGEEITVGSGPACATIAASAYDLLRSLAGRRSLHQLCALDWDGDPAGFLPVLSAYGTPRDDLDD